MNEIFKHSYALKIQIKRNGSYAKRTLGCYSTYHKYANIKLRINNANID